MCANVDHANVYNLLFDSMIDLLDLCCKSKTFTLIGESYIQKVGAMDGD